MSVKLSYVHGSSDVPLIGETIGAYFDRIAQRFPDREALVVRHQGVRWTYAEFRRRVDEFAAGLIALGLAPGDRVGIWSQNNAEWVVTQFATAKAGLILVNVNPAYRQFEVEYVLQKVGAKALIIAERFKTSDYVGMVAALAPELASCEPGKLASAALPELLSVITIGPNRHPGCFTFDEVSQSGARAGNGAVVELSARLQFDDAVNIQFTSGTTGFPKGATLTHHGLLNNAYFIARAQKLTERDRLCIPVPLYHCFGMVLSNLAIVSVGGTMVFPDEAFNARAVLETVEAERCTALNGVPTMFIAELEHPEFANYDLTSLRTGIMAGAPCPIETMRRVVSAMHMGEVTIAYGMTETSPVSFQSSVDDPIERRVTSVGRVQPHIEVKLVDSDGRIVPCGQTGELLTRGYSVMLGYWGDPERTAEAVDQAGWMHTGDLATIDDEGYCNIVGRVKDMVIRGGENLYPREIEEYLHRHPQVVDVQVVGVPDRKFGEELCAWIILKEGAKTTEEEIREFCRGKIAHYKVPRYIRFRQEFPTTVTGKVQKFAIRDAMIEELNLALEKTA